MLIYPCTWKGGGIRQELPSKSPTKLRLLSLKSELHIFLCSRWQQKAAHSTDNVADLRGAMALQECWQGQPAHLALPLGSWATTDSW